MSKTNSEIIKKYIQQVWEAGNSRIIEELIAPDFEYNVSISKEVKDKAWYCRFVATMRQPFVNTKVEIISVVAEDDNVAIYFRILGKQAEKAFGIESRGKEVYVDVMSFFTLKGGKITRCQAVMDLGAMTAQLK